MTNYRGTRVHFGHGLGVIVHDDPQMVPSNEERIQEDMIINIVPIYVDPGVEAYHIEDLVWVTSDGPKVLTGKLPDEELFVIP